MKQNVKRILTEFLTGGNGQKSAMSRQRNQAKADAQKAGGGGKSGMEGRHC